MSAVVDAISSAVGDVADAVGSVVSGAVDLAGKAIQTVADNPLLIVAAIAAPEVLGALATDAVGYEALDTAVVDAGGVLGSVDTTAGVIGAVDTASVVTPSILTTAGGLGEGLGATGDIAGTIGAGAADSFTPSLLTTSGGVGTETIGSAFNFAPIDQATKVGTSILDASNANVAAFTEPQTLASTVINNSPTWSLDNNFLSSNVFSQAQQAASFAESPGMSFSDAISTATQGSITPNASTSIFSNAWDTAKGLGQSISDMNTSAGRMINSIGETIAPGANPMVQKYLTNTAVNTVLNGGDLESALKNGAIGTVAGISGSQVSGATSDMLGPTGSSMLGSATANATGTALSGGDIGKSLLSAGIGAVGTGVSNVSGSPLLGGATKTALSSGLGGGDVGNSLLGYGINAGINAGSNALGVNTGTSSPLGIIGRYATSALLGGSGPSITAQPMTGSLLKQNNAPSILSSVASNTNTITNPLSNKNIPPQTVDVSTLQPVNNIQSLLGKI
jgi:hypothetical protein